MAEFLFLVRHIFHWVFSLSIPPYGGGTTGCNLFDVACACGGGLQLCLENNAEEDFFLYFYFYLIL